MSFRFFLVSQTVDVFVVPEGWIKHPLGGSRFADPKGDKHPQVFF